MKLAVILAAALLLLAAAALDAAGPWPGCGECVGVGDLVP